MAKISVNLKELRDAEIRYISLVDRAATRIPFRVLKRDGEQTMDLTKIFKTDQKPEITAVIVRDLNDDKVTADVRTSIVAAGFSVDKVTKSDGTLVYAQTDKQPKTVQLVRLSDDVVLAVKGLSSPSDGTFSEMVAANGFYSGLNVAMDVLQQKISDEICNGEDSKTLSSDVGDLIDEFKSYCMDLISGLPDKAFKMEVKIKGIMETKRAADPATISAINNNAVTQVPSTELEGLAATIATAPQSIAQNDWDKMSPVDKIKWYITSFQNDNVPPAGPDKNVDTTNKGATGTVQSTTQSNDQLAQPLDLTTKSDKEKKEEEDKKKKEDEDKAKTEKAELDNKFNQIMTSLTGLTSKVDGVVTKQVEQQKVLDAVVTKTDNLGTKLGVVTTAPPRSEDPPSIVNGLTTRKNDCDPRTGCFDTAFLPGRGRARG